MKIKKLKIGPITYKVKYKKDVIVNNVSSYAAIAHSLAKIEVCKDLDDQQIIASLIHESLHGILYNAGICQSDHNEQIIETIACGILALLQDNTDLLKLIK